MEWRVPMIEVITDLNDGIKGLSSGFASFDFEDSGYEEKELVKVGLFLNGEEVRQLGMVVVKEESMERGKQIVDRLKKEIPRQMFTVAVQAMVGSRVVSRSTIQQLRKDVTAKCYGGDVTRKRKLLDKQKAGKKRMKTIGNIQLSQDVFFSLLAQDRPRTADSDDSDD